MMRVYVWAGLSVLTMLFSGCGGESTGSTAPVAESVVYDTEGEIDLSAYMMSETNATATYKETAWVDESGKAQYIGDGNEAYPVYHYEKEGNSTSRYKENSDEKVYMQTAQTMLHVSFAEAEGNVTFDYARYVDTGELVLLEDSNITKDGKSIVRTRSCHVYSIDEAQKSLDGTLYSDLVKLKCNETRMTLSTFDGDAFVKNSTISYIGVFAKDNGAIEEAEEGCTKRTLNGEAYGKHICTKQEWKLINIVK